MREGVEWDFEHATHRKQGTETITEPPRSTLDPPDKTDSSSLVRIELVSWFPRIRYNKTIQWLLVSFRTIEHKYGTRSSLWCRRRHCQEDDLHRSRLYAEE